MGGFYFLFFFGASEMIFLGTLCAWRYVGKQYGYRTSRRTVTPWYGRQIEQIWLEKCTRHRKRTSLPKQVPRLVTSKRVLVIFLVLYRSYLTSRVVSALDSCGWMGTREFVRFRGDFWEGSGMFYVVSSILGTREEENKTQEKYRFCCNHMGRVTEPAIDKQTVYQAPW